MEGRGSPNLSPPVLPSRLNRLIHPTILLFVRSAIDVLSILTTMTPATCAVPLLFTMLFTVAHSFPTMKREVSADIPFHNVTGLNEEIVSGWRPSPRTRGTFDIVWDCVITLAVCVYTAIHVNVSASSEKGSWQQLRSRMKWTIIGIFAPELVLYTAWN